LSANLSVNTQVPTIPTPAAKPPRIEKIALSPEMHAKVEKILASGLRPVTKSNAMSKICGTCQCGNIPTLKLIYDCDGASRVEKYCEKCWEIKNNTDKDRDKIKAQFTIVESCREYQRMESRRF
jgi:hypothetical protein